MKQIFFCIASLLIIITGYSQNSLQIKDQRFEIHAVQYEKSSRVETNDYGLNINYETGDLLATINLVNSTLYNEEEVKNRIPGGEIIEISGTIPINEIMDGEASNQTYNYELSVRYTGNLVMTGFQFNVIDIPTSSQNVKIFQVQGTIDLRDFEIENLKGYDPEVVLYMDFQTFMLGG